MPYNIGRLLERFHDLTIAWLIAITFIVFYGWIYIISYKRKRFLATESETLEAGWTVLPIIILFSLAIPRIYILNVQDKTFDLPQFTTKVIGIQWSWVRENTLDEERRLDHLLELEHNLNRLEVPIWIPSLSLIRFIISRTDVLHSLGIPSLGIKLDAIPGRLNRVYLRDILPGWFFGSCYELCGTGHSSMPITLVRL